MNDNQDHFEVLRKIKSNLIAHRELANELALAWYLTIA